MRRFSIFPDAVVASIPDKHRVAVACTYFIILLVLITNGFTFGMQRVHGLFISASLGKLPKLVFISRIFKSMALSKIQENPYRYVLAWFLKQYENYDEYKDFFADKEKNASSDQKTDITPLVAAA